MRLHNSKTRMKQDFVPLDPNNVRLYVCGPTVYDRAHLGNGRPVVVFDVLYRLLRQIYGPQHVTYVRNFTDVDDKINAKAAATGRSIADICDETIGWYHDDMDALGALRPNFEPRATAFIPQMIEMIAGLIAGGHAYAVEGHVLFRVRSYSAYGALSGRSIDDMIAGARVEVAPYKEDPMDFVLWKPSLDQDPGWDSPWGFGRPGWHIECSAMSYELLGASFDIHGGGLDLQFPHHENEIAQSCCAHPQGGFAQIWMHNEMLQVEGKKMSKSLGNFFTVRDLLDQGISGAVIRMVYMSTHYSKPMDWTVEKSVEAEARIFGWIEIIARSGDLARAQTLAPDRQIINALQDDLNTHEALRILGCMNGAQQADDLARNMEFLGILSRDQIAAKVGAYRLALDILRRYGAKLHALREAAKLSNDFSKVDAMKADLASAKVAVMMGKAEVVLRPEIGFDAADLPKLD